ncbi:MAG: hypothetical protein KDD84_18645, partial [Caldilineaceae bacterium]|nr:hypothetical protein [Caldilineaceae bacterium]
MCTQTSSSDASGTLYDSGGVGSNYSDNETCGFVITPSGGVSSISLTFSAFNLENGYDKLYVYDGTSTGDTLLATLTGTSLPGNLTATSGSMYLRFTSDYNVNSSGFAATWSSTVSTPTPTPTPACPAGDSDADGLDDCEEDANIDADNNPATNPGPDTDGDTTPNYLDADDDGDGIPTASENADPNGDG